MVYSSFQVFGSGFVEASTNVNMGHPQQDHDDGDTASDLTSLFRQFEDSDDEEDDLMSDLPDEPSFDTIIEPDAPEASVSPTSGEAPMYEDAAANLSEGTTNTENNVVPSVAEGDESRNVKPRLSHPSSPRNKDVSLMTDPYLANSFTACLPETPPVPGPRKMRVIVDDVAYATYKAVLYYVRRRQQLFRFSLIGLCRYIQMSSFSPLCRPPLRLLHHREGRKRRQLRQLHLTASRVYMTIRNLLHLPTTPHQGQNGS